jgi:hypothetical protein
MWVGDQKQIILLGVAIFLGFWRLWTVNRLATQHMGTPNLSPRCSILATNGRISTTKVWPNHFNLLDNLEAFTFQLEGASNVINVVYLFDQ